MKRSIIGGILILLLVSLHVLAEGGRKEIPRIAHLEIERNSEGDFFISTSEGRMELKRDEYTGPPCAQLMKMLDDYTNRGWRLVNVTADGIDSGMHYLLSKEE